MREHAPTLRRAVLKAGWVEAPDWVAGRLGLPAGVRIFRAERVDTLGRQPVAWDEAFIVQSFTKGLDRRLLKRVNFFDVWVRRSGFSAGTDEQLVEAVPASAACARRLRIARSAPVLKCTETFFMNSRVPVAIFVSYYHPGYMCIRSRSPWSVSRPRGRPVIGSSDSAKREPGATG
jgi:DNA-binding GntR family transcriptional regulator